ncbi:MAG: polysaccharide deacetylase family protein [Deltaproteobacteria bacterium]|nr:polysaccharide deacetylase family protein [Deltaproteobacteria bacterium]
MPLRTKTFVGLAIAAWLAAVVLAVLAAPILKPFGSALAAAALGAGGLYALFVYYPKFDPTGSTAWQGGRQDRRIAITFDDGPGPDTAAILDVLKTKGVKATFFFLGANAARLPDPVRRARDEGHAVGNHGFSHAKMHRMTGGVVEREVLSAEDAIGEISTAAGRKILRAPHGFKSLTLVCTLRRLGYTLVAWTAGVWDSDRPGAAVIVKRVKAAVRPGCILLLHDGDGTRPDADRSQTAAALKEIVDFCLSGGYKFATIPEIFDGRP